MSATYPCDPNPDIFAEGTSYLRQWCSSIKYQELRVEMWQAIFFVVLWGFGTVCVQVSLEPHTTFMLHTYEALCTIAKPVWCVVFYSINFLTVTYIRHVYAC